jgi:transcriptional regulator with XRE-family HTH domain
MRDPDELRDAMVDFRKANDLSVAEAAAKANVSAPTWTAVERGQTKKARFQTRLRIEYVLPAPWTPPDRTDLVSVVDAHQRRTSPPQTERRVPPNRYDLSNGRIKCQITTARALPAPAFAVLAELVTVIEATEAKLHELLGDEPKPGA